jgi:hypothetical protein
LQAKNSHSKNDECVYVLEATRVLSILSPDIGAQYFRDVGAVINAGTPPDRTRLLAVMSGNGLVPAAPPG